MHILITGISGYISQFLLKHKPGNVSIIGTYHKKIPESEKDLKLIPLNLTKNVNPQLKKVFPDVVIHTAAISNLGLCEKYPETAFRINGKATDEIALWCNKQKIRLIYLSTDIVFDGQHASYNEKDEANPINVYGQSKYKGELAVQKCKDFAISRLALVLGQSLNENKNFVDWIVDKINNNQNIPLYYDEIRTPVNVSDAARIIWKIALSKQQGIFHLCSEEKIDRFTLGQEICKYYKYDLNRIKKVSAKNSGIRRPLDTSLINSRLKNIFDIKIPPVIKNINRLFYK